MRCVSRPMRSPTPIRAGRRTGAHRVQRRGADGTYAVLTMSPLGGAEQKLADLPALLSGISWSPDGKWLAVARTVRLRPRRTTPPGFSLSRRPAVTRCESRPHGHPCAIFHPGSHPMAGSLAFVRSMGPGPLRGRGLHPATGARRGRDGRPRQITHSGMFIAGLAWHPDGRLVVYAGQPAFLLCYLYRVSIDGDAPPEGLELAGPSAYAPSASAGNQPAGLQQAQYRLGRLAPPAGWRRRARHPVLVLRLRAATLARWAPRRVTSNRNGESC